MEWSQPEPTRQAVYIAGGGAREVVQAHWSNLENHEWIHTLDNESITQLGFGFCFDLIEIVLWFFSLEIQKHLFFFKKIVQKTTVERLNFEEILSF